MKRLTLIAGAIACVATMVDSAGAWTGAPWYNADGTPTAWMQECIDAWEDAPAEAHCSANVKRFTATASTFPEYCFIEQVSCSVDVHVNGDDGTILTTFTESQHGFIDTPADTSDITLCWTEEDGAWEMDLRSETCDSDETDLATATSTGVGTRKSKNEIDG